MADFAVDKDKRDKLVQALTKAAGDIESLTEEIYSGIADMEGPDSWEGTSYTSFKGMCDSYRGALDGLAQMLQAFSKIIGTQIDGPQETLETELHGALD